MEVPGASALVLPAEPSTILSPAPAAAETRIEEGYHLDIIEDEEDEMEESLDSFNWTDPQEGGLEGGVGIRQLSVWHPNAQGGAANQRSKLQPQGSSVQKMAGKVRLGMVEQEEGEEDHWDPGQFAMDSKVHTSIRQSTNRQLEGTSKSRDRSDRATVETVLDPRTRMVLFKMLNSGLFSVIHGCISTGKEANVYHAVTAEGRDLAVKVYKTSILAFKDRDRYVSGDPRFRSYNKGNPRKMVKMWAEKEMRNLARLHAAGIRCPTPLQLRTHVLVMDFIGREGVAALRLKDAKMPLPRLQSMYTEMVLLIRKLYQECRLVHGDLSEYNILVNDGELYIIDVSQAVDLDHPRALDFLREDATHVNAFFRRAGIATLSTRELFEFTVDPHIDASNIDAALDGLCAAAASRPAATADEDQTADNVFVQTHIPRALEEVEDHEKDYDRLAGGAAVEGIYYQTITGMRQDMSGAREGPASAQAALQVPPQGSAEAALDNAGSVASKGEGDSESSASDESSDDSESCSSGSEEEGGSPRRRGATPEDREAAKAARKQHKKDVKESNKERRKSKVPKHVKKKQVMKGKKKR